MRVLIPACGRGERFRAQGYEDIKPLIPVIGKAMIHVVTEALCVDDNRDTCVVVTNFDDSVPERGFTTVRLARATVGAAETAALALGTVSATNDASLLLVDCDAVYHCDVIERFRALEKQPEVRAAVLCFEESARERETAAKYSYVETSGDGGRVTKIAEKSRVGPYANTGAYWFASEKEFLELTKDILTQEGKFERGEAYVSCVLKEYVARDKHVSSVVIAEDQYSNIGTPECLEQYLSKQGYAFLFDLDGTLVDTTDAYVAAWREILAPMGAFVDEEFFLKHISGQSDAQVAQRFKLQISSEQKDEAFLRYIEKTKEIPGAVEFVQKCRALGPVSVVTNSNRTAAKALLKHLALDDLPLISASDVRFGKPNAEPYLKAARRLGVSIGNSIVFEDSRCGLISGRAAGCQYVVSVNTNVSGSDSFIANYVAEDPEELLETMNSVAHLSNELSEVLGQRSVVYPIRASGGYISEILSATSGSRHLVVKQENSDHGVLMEVSEHLNLHDTECKFYEDFASIMPVRVPICYGVLPTSRAIVMEDLRKYDRAPDFCLESGLKVVNTMARLHSQFRGAPLGRLSVYDTYMRQHVQEHYATFRNRWFNTLGEQVFVLFDHAAANFADAELRLRRAPQTLLHGDLKFPNLFWDYQVNGGEPIFIDWQYARPGQGIEDIVFLLVESCDIEDFEQLAEVLVNTYYDSRQKLDNVVVPKDERIAQVSSALAGFPLFVAVWFGCIDASKLSEPNFPFMYILRLANAFTHLYDAEWAARGVTSVIA